MQLSTAMLDKKIGNMRDGSLRNNRSSTRISQDFIPLEERKNGNVFRISAFLKEPKDLSSQISKEKIELLAEVDKKQQ